MRIFVKYLNDYFKQIPLRSLVFTTLFTAILITINFTIGIEKRIYALAFPFSVISFIIFYFFVIWNCLLFSIYWEINFMK